MKELLEGSMAVAEMVKLCKPGVISAYPITPQTHIVEELAQIVADGHLNAQFVNVESEHSAASVVLGAVAAGVRAYTATSSQGLFYMAEVLYNIAGMRLPVIMTTAARAISAPINIWNDHQDVVSLRDAGWVQFHAEDVQEAVDLHLIAYRLGEDKSIMLPVMVCMDGFVLTHGLETVDMPTQEQVDKFLPNYKAPYKLDIENPLTLGPLVDPEYYMEARYALNQTHKEALAFIPKLTAEFAKVFGRTYNGLVEGYQLKDAEKVIVAMGSVCGSIKDVVDAQRKKGNKVGLLKVISYRPFPAEEVTRALAKTRSIGVVEKDISLGATGALYAEIKAVTDSSKNVSGFVAGLGGRDITVTSIQRIIELTGKETNSCTFIDLNTDILWDEFHEA